MSPRNTLDILEQTAVGDEQDIIDCMVEVELNEDKPFHVFLAVKETLTRIGIYVPKRVDAEKWGVDDTKVLYQTCHILQKNNKHYIVHFKHLFILDGRTNGFHREDVMRMNSIILLLESWGLYKVKNPSQITELADIRHIKVLKHSDVKEHRWVLRPKYNMRYAR